MNDSVRFAIVAGAPAPVFNEETLQTALKAAVLREATTAGDDLASLIQEARTSILLSVTWSGNEVSLDLHSDHAVITHQWIAGDDGNDAVITIPLDELERLLNEWRVLLAAHWPDSTRK